MLREGEESRPQTDVRAQSDQSRDMSLKNECHATSWQVKLVTSKTSLWLLWSQEVGVFFHSGMDEGQFLCKHWDLMSSNQRCMFCFLVTFTLASSMKTTSDCCSLSRKFLVQHPVCSWFHLEPSGQRLHVFPSWLLAGLKPARLKP